MDRAMVEVAEDEDSVVIIDQVVEAAGEYIGGAGGGDLAFEVGVDEMEEHVDDMGE